MVVYRFFKLMNSGYFFKLFSGCNITPIAPEGLADM